VPGDLVDAGLLDPRVAAPARHVAWRPRVRRTKCRVGPCYTEPYGSVFSTSLGVWQVRPGQAARSSLVARGFARCSD
jgi:hypothetical protein